MQGMNTHFGLYVGDPFRYSSRSQNPPTTAANCGSRVETLQRFSIQSLILTTFKLVARGTLVTVIFLEVVSETSSNVRQTDSMIRQPRMLVLELCDSEAS